MRESFAEPGNSESLPGMHSRATTSACPVFSRLYARCTAVMVGDLPRTAHVVPLHTRGMLALLNLPISSTAPGYHSPADGRLDPGPHGDPCTTRIAGKPGCA